VWKVNVMRQGMACKSDGRRSADPGGSAITTNSHQTTINRLILFALYSEHPNIIWFKSSRGINATPIGTRRVNLPQETFDANAFFNSLEERMVRGPGGEITFRPGPDEERRAFMRQWLILTGRDPDDYED
jgi:hypothetical protein